MIHEQLFQLSPDPAWIIENNRFVDCNEAAVRAQVKEGIPVLMVYGEKDVIFKLLSDAKESYSDYVPSRLKPNPLHKRIIIDSDHRSVPERASSQVIEWLKTLP